MPSQRTADIVQRNVRPAMSQVEPLRRRRPLQPSRPSIWGNRLLNYGLVFVTVVLVTDALVGDKGLLDTMRARRQYAEVATSLAQKRRENERLRDEIRRLKEDPSAIESLAREELGLMREGEVLFVVHDVTAAK
jgi:cell division protein FtsB